MSLEELITFDIDIKEIQEMIEKPVMQYLKK